MANAKNGEKSGDSKKYDVYGIGNALVDMEFEVEAEFLQLAGIEKGLMTLVDENRQSEIINTLHGIQHKRSCGGSAANTMIAVSQFGGNSFYSCKVASDEVGDFYFKDLMDNGVETNLSSSSLEPGITGKCIVLITPDADRTMNTFLGITQTFSTKEIVEEGIKNSKYVYIEGYLVASPTGKEAAIKARKIAEENNVKTALTFSDVNMVTYFYDGLKEMIGEGVDLLFCNESEAYAFTKTKTVLEAAAVLKKIAKTFAITLGPKGAFLFDGEKEVYVVTIPVEAVDTNGAGDLFAGAFLYAINSGISYPEAAKLGCMASSQLVTQFGARLRREQVLEIKLRAF
jgi:sugar/nucleoside kinase (ribokinase family)